MKCRVKKNVIVLIVMLLFITGCSSGNVTTETTSAPAETPTENPTIESDANMSEVKESEDISETEESISSNDDDPSWIVERIEASYSGDTDEGTVLDEDNIGIDVTAYYEDGTNGVVLNDDIKIEKPQKLKAGKTSTITIEYMEKKCKLKVKCTSLTSKQYKSKCRSIPYKKLARRPDKYEGKKIMFTGEVLQIVDELDGAVELLMYTEKGYFGYSDNLIHVIYLGGSNKDRILEDDVITVWGEYNGLYSYETTNGNENTIPDLTAKYYKLH